jgi:phage gpG-like protein
VGRTAVDVFITGATKPFMLRVEKNLANPPAEMMSNIGKELVATSQLAFKEQHLGEHQWKPKYPNQSQPKINIAAAVEDLRRGPTVKIQHLTQDRPALSDTGHLEGSINWRQVDALTVECGPSVGGDAAKYAALHQKGGRSVQKIDDTVRKNLAQWLAPPGGGKGPRGGRRQHGKVKSGIGSIYRKKMGFLFQRDELVTTINPRPFLGVTSQCADNVRRIIEGDIPK